MNHPESFSSSSSGQTGVATPKSHEGGSSVPNAESVPLTNSNFTDSQLPSDPCTSVSIRGCHLLHQIRQRFEHYLVLPPGAAVALTLWTAHAHCFTAFRLTPRLNLQSPEPGCGKTTTLDVIASLVPRPVRTENLTAPILFRLVDQSQPTLLLDEVDAYLPQAEELRGLLNAGHKRGACAYRCVNGSKGKSNLLRKFKAFAPAVLSGLGKLPGTLHDRSIHIPLIKAEPGQIKAWFDESNADLEAGLNHQLVLWTAENFDAIRDLAASRAISPSSPQGSDIISGDSDQIENRKSKIENLTLRMPATAHNRLGDNWRPLFAIAEIAGGDWPQLAFDAFNKLALNSPKQTTLNHSPTLDARPSALDSSVLLAAIRDVFFQSGQQRIHCRDLVTALRSKSGTHCEISEKRLTRRLNKLGIPSRNIRINDRQAKGYERAVFESLFACTSQPRSSQEL